MTELVGSRYCDIIDVPTYVRKLVGENCPGFLDQVDFANEDSDIAPAKRPYWWGRQHRQQHHLNLRRAQVGVGIDDFHSKGDPLDRYKPWYTQLMAPFRRKKVAAITELLANR